MSTPDREIDPMEMLHRASTEEAVPQEAQARVWSAVTGALQAAAAGSAVGVTSAALANGGKTMRPWVAKLLYWSAPAFVVGAAAGVTAGRAMAPAVSPGVHATSVTTVATALPSPASSVEEAEILPLATTEPPTAFAPAPQSSGGVKLVGSAGELARERALLDQARAQIAAGEPARALDYVDRHGRRHPHGALSEEREALAVNALVSLGRYREALARGETFRNRYPNSLLMPSVDAALLTIPER